MQCNLVCNVGCHILTIQCHLVCNVGCHILTIQWILVCNVGCHILTIKCRYVLIYSLYHRRHESRPGYWLRKGLGVYDHGFARFTRLKGKQMDRLSNLVRRPPLGQDLQIRRVISNTNEQLYISGDLYIVMKIQTYS